MDRNSLAALHEPMLPSAHEPSAEHADDPDESTNRRSRSAWRRLSLWLRHQWRVKFNSIPPGIMAMFFLHSMMQTFPLTAFSGWLYDDIKMTNINTLNDYYALEFLPYCMKPLYGWISETFPIRGYRRRPYLRASAVGSAACYLVTGLLVHSIPAAFFVSVLRVICNAFADLMISVATVDTIQKNADNAGAVQSAAFSARDFGSVVAVLVGLAMYPKCGSQPPNSTVIALTAVFPALIAMLASYLPEAPVKPRGCRPNCCYSEEDSDQEAASILPRGETIDDSTNVGGALTPDILLPVGEEKVKDDDEVGIPWIVILLLQVVFVWATLQSLLPYNTWWKVLLGLGVGLPAAAAVLSFVIGYWQQGSIEAVLQQINRYHASFLLAVFALSYNSVPNDDVALGKFTFDAFESKKERCLQYLQYLQLVTYCSNLFASITYGVVFNRKNTLSVIVVTTILAAAASLVALPMVQFHTDHPNDLDGFFGWACANNVITGFMGQLAFVAVLVLISQHCSANPGILYALYLSFLDLGDTASEITTKFFGHAVVGDDYANVDDKPESLMTFVKASAGMQAGSAALVVIMLAQRWWSRRCAEDNS